MSNLLTPVGVISALQEDKEVEVKFGEHYIRNLYTRN